MTREEHFEQLSQSINGNYDATVALQAVELGNGSDGSSATANTARVDPTGSDSTGAVGDLNKPFLTCQGALTALEIKGGFTQNSPAVVVLPVVDTVENVTTSLQFLVIQASANIGDGAATAIDNVTLTNDGSSSPGGVYLSLNNLWVHDVLAPNVGNDSQLNLYLNSATISGDVTTTGAVYLSATYNTGAVDGTITCGDGTGITVRGLIGNYGNENFPNINAVNSPLYAYFSLLNDVTATDVTMNDSRFIPGGTLNISGTTTYNDAFLGGGGIGGSIADQQVAFGNGTDIAGDDNLKFDTSVHKLTVGSVELNVNDDGTANFLGGDLFMDGVAPGAHIGWGGGVSGLLISGPDVSFPSISIDSFTVVLAANGSNTQQVLVQLLGRPFEVSGGPLQLDPIDKSTLTPSEGMIVADIDNHLYYYNGTAWKQLDNTI